MNITCNSCNIVADPHALSANCGVDSNYDRNHPYTYKIETEPPDLKPKEPEVELVEPERQEPCFLRLRLTGR